MPRKPINFSEDKIVIQSMDFSDALRQFGIDYLTGESCGYALRALFDVTETGQKFISVFFGDIDMLRNGWNNHQAKSILLPKIMIADLLVFCLLEDPVGYSHVIIAKNGTDTWVRAYRDYDLAMEEARKHTNLEIAWRIVSGQNRNTHAMSGRTY